MVDSNEAVDSTAPDQRVQSMLNAMDKTAID